MDKINLEKNFFIYLDFKKEEIQLEKFSQYSNDK